MNAHANAVLDEIFPPMPDIDADLLERCRGHGDYAPVLFRWYQHVGLVCSAVSGIRPASAGVRDMPALHYAVLIGLLSRCTRLMFANTALSHQGLFGETTAILDRCIFESIVKLKWLCADADRFEPLVLDGLRSDVELKGLIRQNIADRGGGTLCIEERMLASIDDILATVPTTEEAVRASTRLPDLFSMITAIGGDRLMYVVGQRMGSHAVHGTWVALRRQYLEAHDGELVPRDHDCPTHPNQYVFVMLSVLDAMDSFIGFALEPSEERTMLLARLEAVRAEIVRLNTELVGNDFENANV